jgi:hypothetical protein
MRTILGGEEVRSGAIYGGLAIALDAIPSDLQLEVVGRAAAFVAFKDHANHEDELMPVVQTLEEMQNLLVDSVLPRFKAFIR